MISRIFVSVKEQVTDILESFNFLQKRLDSMNEKVDGLETEVHQLTRANQKLTKENKQLKQRLSKYETPDKNSSNSSTPPGKEKMRSESKRRTQSLREKSNNPIGGQLGHKGCTREVVDNPDTIIDHHSEYCTECGADLFSSESVLDYTSQEIDIPIIEPVIREHRHYTKVCYCGCKNRSFSPRRRGGNAIVFGKNVRALVLYYSVVQCIPNQRMQSMLKNIFGIEMENLLKEAIHTRNESLDERIETKSWLIRLDNLLDWNLEKLDDKFKTLRNGLYKYRDYIFKFLENPLVPPTNNSSERGFRKLKVKNKISGTFRSDDGADAFFSLHSIIETATKHKQPALETLLAIF